MKLVYDAMDNKPTYSYETPKTWGTWDGRKLSIGELEHQHLSNIYWFNIILHNRVYLFVKNELEKRFDGVLLAYRPDVRFDPEIKGLEKKGLLVWNLEKTYGHIVMHDGNVIGEVKNEINLDDL